MSSDKIQIYLIIGSIGIIIFFMYLSILKYNSLTAYQKSYRTNLIFRQGIIILSCMCIAFSINKASVYLYNSLNISLSQNVFSMQIFLILSILVFIIVSVYNSKIDKKDERVVNLRQETTFTNLTSVEKKVKKIKDYAHCFSSINYEYSPKDYTVKDVNINISKQEISKFHKNQLKQFEITTFYLNLIEYLNSKSTNFKHLKIEKDDIKKLKNLKELKILILDRFKYVDKNNYYASISQLFQIANSDETEFLSFLRDSQHSKYSTLSLKHAIYYINYVKKDN